jgi:DUF1009 family protein
MDRLAILAGAGALPVQLAGAYPDAVQITFDGVAHDLGAGTHVHAFETLGALFDDLRSHNVTKVVLAGSMSRPPLNPARFDSYMQSVAPRLLAAFQQGDDALLSLVIALFEEQGFIVVGAHELLPDLTFSPVHIGPDPSSQDLDDATQAQDILHALSPLDLGQSAVVAAGLCLGIETIQGTDALLRFTALTPPHLRRAKGVLVKMPKRGQDLRVDMPAIGPDTIRNAATAGLSGIIIAAHKTLILDQTATRHALTDTGLFLRAEDL